MKPIPVFGYVCGLGASDTNTRFGAQAIAQQLPSQHFVRQFFYPASAAQGLAAIPVLAEINSYLAQNTFTAVEEKQPFITIGGDHSCAIGTWSGVAAALQNQGDLGLIWFDAHMDSHTPDTTPSNNVHGMPVACLLGHGDAALTQILTAHAKIKPENLCLIGVRSFESGEKKLLEDLKVRIFYMDEIEQRGLDVVIEEAVAIVSQKTSGFGISFDLDAIDPHSAPGVGSPAPDGIQPKPLLKAINSIQNHPQLLGLEIAEYNPNLDIEAQTQKFALELINALFDFKEK